MLWHNLHRKWDEMGTYYPVNMWMIVNSRAAGTLLDHPSRKRLCMRFTTAFRAAICAWVKEGFSKTRWVKKLLSPALTIRMLLILWYFHKNSKMKVIWKKMLFCCFCCYSDVFRWNNGSWKKISTRWRPPPPAQFRSLATGQRDQKRWRPVPWVIMGIKWDTGGEERCQKLGTNPPVVGKF